MKTVKEYRISQCLTQLEVMKAIGMESRSNYSKIENRKHSPGLRTKRKIAQLFKVSPLEIDW